MMVTNLQSSFTGEWKGAGGGGGGVSDRTMPKGLTLFDRRHILSVTFKK